MHFHLKILFSVFLIYLNLSNGDSVAEKPSTDPTASVAESITSFGRKLITSIESTSKPNENLLISPANIFHAVALLHMAAKGNTLKEVTNLMGISESNQNYSKPNFHSSVSSFYKNIITNDSHSTVLNIADALFLQNGFKIKKDYLDNAVKMYQAQIENVNFTAGDEAVKKVNGWVSQKTRERIPKVVESFSPYTQAVMISTLYFKANWENTFKNSDTRKEKFFTAGSEMDVQMMNLIKRFKYVNNTELQFEAIDLPYSHSNYALNIILPYSNQTIKNLMPKLTNISTTKIMEDSKYMGVHLKLPKTKFNVGKSLIETFQQLGVKDLFTEANLTDLTDTKLRVSQILHSAEIDIREEGTVASAATSISFLLKSGTGRVRDPLPFYVTRPFIINIYDKKTALNLFTGVVYKPEASI